MSKHTTNKPWDFSHVLDLVHALSPPAVSEKTNDDYFRKAKGPKNAENGVDKQDFASTDSGGVSLGDFTKIWHFLGTPPPEQSGPKVDVKESHHQASFVSKDDYASDGAVRYGSPVKSKKKVTWKQDTSADEDLVTESASEVPARSSDAQPGLTKSQRKKQRRRERKAALDSTLGTVSESEADTVWSTTPARKASTHAVASSQSVPRIGARSKSIAAIPTTATIADQILTTSAENGEPTRSDEHSPSTPGRTRPETTIRQNSEPVAKVIDSTNDAKQDSTQWPVSAAQANNTTTRFLPASVGARTPPAYTKNSLFAAPDTAKAVQAFQAAQAELAAASPSLSRAARTPSNLPARPRFIEPKIVRSGEDRNWALLLKLINDYDEDRKYLVAPMNMTTHNNHPNGIHVFVDASNIFIGFNDQLKRARGIPTTARVPPVDLSFDALALLMERRRPVAKRILVGSMPNLPAFDKAKAVGYECSILEKVYKARELTERQIYFRDSERRYQARAKAAGQLLSSSPSHNSGYHSATDDYGTASGSETMASGDGPQFAPAKMIEQGVDEILHLKILESIVDSEEPATMVIATGDAAQAEYSDGFMAMTQRALKKGWKVELVSWSKNISSMYLRRSFRDVWENRFRVIYLDDYAEELLDM